MIQSLHWSHYDSESTLVTYDSESTLVTYDSESTLLVICNYLDSQVAHPGHIVIPSLHWSHYDSESTLVTL